jgi:enolase
MSRETTIMAVTARQVYSDRGHPGVEVTVRTANDASGVAVCTAGVSIGQHEVPFAYDDGKTWRGRGVGRAVANIMQTIAPALVGMDAANQLAIDDAILTLGGPGAKERLGGNATAAVSAAALKAGAAALGIPLYQHIGGVGACTLPVAGELACVGSDRYGGGARSGGKPSYSFMAHGFPTFSDASYAIWDISTEWRQVLKQAFGISSIPGSIYPVISAGIVKDDREILDLMMETVNRLGYEGRVGFHVDVAAATYYDAARERFVGLFSREERSRDDLMRLYQDWLRRYPFVNIEDPLDEEDYDGHAVLTRELGIQITGDDLFTTNPERVRKGIELGACNAVLLKVNQVGTISEAFDMVRLAYRYGYGVMPCSSRGEGAEIADYAVGLNSGVVRESATGPRGNRLLQIQAELGQRAFFPGRAGLRGGAAR